MNPDVKYLRIKKIVKEGYPKTTTMKRILHESIISNGTMLVKHPLSSAPCGLNWRNLTSPIMIAIPTQPLAHSLF